MPDRNARQQLHRYRTRALVGPWQPNIGAALDDAIRAGQASVDARGQVHWIVCGEIETGEPEE